MKSHMNEDLSNMAIFPTADDARLDSQNSLVIFDEVRAIEYAIIVASGLGQLEVILNDNTTMTNSTPSDVTSQSYFDVWKLTVIDRAKTNQMTKVIQYFEGQGYTILRQTNGNSADALQWFVSW